MALFAFSVAPSVAADGSGSVSEAVADAVRVVRDSGLPYELTSMFTTIEGEWDEVLPVVRAACDAAAAHGPRVSLVLKADLRPGHEDQLRTKVERVRDRLGEDPR
ncbi:thiamine-binding protein [Ornithinimicrobium sp. W1679]|uniref:thiamine-binding protein n=1 Tax=unclassified Ornithinimicrobium TaxID=2615080 RepID=UPI003CEE9F09